MPVSYQSAVDSLLALGPELASKPRRKFDLETTLRLMAALGHPERRFPAVLIAGTNGKGSTSAVLARILEAAGHRTGLYTSPHLIEVNERIRINGELISDPEFTEMHSRVEETANHLVAIGELPGHPSFFEMITAMAFDYFSSSGIDIAVLEVGLGGRLDATNVADPMISVITDIALDHQEWLGNTLSEIAREKAGIIRSRGTVVMLPQHPEANNVLGQIVLSRNAQAISAVEYIPPTSPSVEASNKPARLVQRYPIEVLGERIQVESPLIGAHQVRNTALAVATAVELNRHFGFKVSPRNIEEGIRTTVWPARFDVFPARENFPEIVLDVAHNPAGAWALRSLLSQQYPEREITLLFGCMRDKPIAELASILFPLATRVIATRAESPRAALPEEIVAAGSHTGAEFTLAAELTQALRHAHSLTGREGVVVITGSVYLVGAALRLIAAAERAT